MKFTKIFNFFIKSNRKLFLQKKKIKIAYGIIEKVKEGRNFF